MILRHVASTAHELADDPGYYERVCTILYMLGTDPGLPLVVAANRDELYARSAEPPAVVARDPLVVAGVDGRAGGTWMGANAAGLVVGLTNQRTYRTPETALRSRGEVVRAALDAREPSEVTRLLAGLSPDRYNAFNLLYGTADSLWLAYVRPEAPRVEIAPAPTGVHVLPNDRLGAPGFPKADRARALAQDLVGAPWERMRDGLASILGDHELPERDRVPRPPPGSAYSHDQLWRRAAICTHGEVYGTCSATIMAAAPGRILHYLFADGPPCQHPFRDLGGLFDA